MISTALQTLLTLVNGGIDSTNVSATAGLARSQLATGAGYLARVATSATTFTAADGQLVNCLGASPTTVTLPAQTDGRLVGVRMGTSAGAVTVQVNGGAIFGPGVTNASSIQLGTPGSYVVLMSDGGNWLILAGGPSAGATVGGGSTNIATSQSTSSTTYTTLTTPDQVTGIVLPANGLIRVWYQATWQESVIGAARAAIFIGSNQLKRQLDTNAAPVVQEASAGSEASANTPLPLSTFTGGLATNGGWTYSGDVTTGQVVGVTSNYGACEIFAAAGNYTIGVEFKTSSGSVTAANRKLWVQALSFA